MISLARLNISGRKDQVLLDREKIMKAVQDAASKAALLTAVALAVAGVALLVALAALVLAARRHAG